MSINIQLEGGLKKLSGQTMSKDKIIEKLGYTPANEADVEADIAAISYNVSTLKTTLENYIKDHPDIVEDGSGEVVFTDEAGNIIAKFDADGLHTTNIEADSFISGDDNLIINDLDGNKIFQVDKDGVETTKLKLASGDVDNQLADLAADIAAVEAKIPEIPVTSVNGKTGDVELAYSDLNNAPDIEAEENEKSLIITDDNGIIVFEAGNLDETDNKITGVKTTEVFLPGGKVDERIGNITANLAAHTGDSVAHITATERNAWNNKSDFSGEFKDLLNSPIEEDNSGELAYADESGNVALRIGKLDENTTGLETVEIKLKGGKVDERIENITADLSAHTGDTTNHITKAERDTWNAKATTTYVDNKVAALVDSAPETLNTLKELSAALGNDENFATTVATELSEKALAADLAAHEGSPTAHTKAQIGLSNVDNTSDLNKPISNATRAAINALKEEIVSESDSWTIADEHGNVMLKAGKLDDGTVGLETTNIIAGNIYTKEEIDAEFAAITAIPANKIAALFA